MIERLRYILFLICFFLVFSNLYPQRDQVHLLRFGLENGLTFDEVNETQFDGNGLLWIATSFGLNRFDGTNNIQFFALSDRKSSSLSGNITTALACDSLVTWIGTRGGGLNCYFDQVDNFIKYRHNPNELNSLPSNDITRLYLARNKKLFVGTDKGFSIFSRAETKFTTFNKHPELGQPLFVTAFAEDKRQDMWIGTRNHGLLYYEMSSRKLSAVQLPKTLRYCQINDLMYEENGNQILMATSNGLWRISLTQQGLIGTCDQPVKALSSNDITVIRRKGGDIWIGTEKDGIFLLKADQELHQYPRDEICGYSLTGQRINHISAGEEGSIWISTPSGLYAYFPELQRFPFFKPGTIAESGVDKTVPGGICLWRQYMFAATDRGVFVSDTGFQYQQGLFAPGKGNVQVSFSTIRVLDNNIFASGTDGLYEIRQEKNSFKLRRPSLYNFFKGFLSEPLDDICKADENLYWAVASSGNVVCLDIKTGVTDTIYRPFNLDYGERAGLPNTKVFTGVQNRIYLAAENGIFIYIRGKVLYEHKNDERFYDTILKRSVINDLYDDGKQIWLATDSKGVFRCDRDLNILDQYTNLQGLCDNTVLCLQPDDKGNIWASTKNGLAMFDTSSKTFSNYFRDNGLPSNQFKIFGRESSDRKTLYFSSDKGIIQFRPYTWKSQMSSKLDPVITKAVIGSKALTRSDLAILNEMLIVTTKYESSVVLSMGTIGFLSSSQFLLQYKLDGIKEWNTLAPGADIVLSRLSPTSHQLYIRVVNKSGSSLGNTLKILINIRPAYYQQWWFIMGIITVVAGLIYLLYNYRIRQIVKVYAVRNKIARDLHDEVGATLSGISMYSHLAGQQVRMEKKNEVENSLEIIQRSADEMISKLNDIVWFVNPQQDSLKKLVEKVEEYAETIASAKNILISASVPAKIENVKLPMENRRNIYLIFKEAINNAVKYSEASLLELSVQANETVVEFFIKDNGKGFDEKIIKKGNGLENMQKRADEIGAKLILSSKKNEGTSLLLQCKIT